MTSQQCRASNNPLTTRTGAAAQAPLQPRKDKGQETRQTRLDPASHNTLVQQRRCSCAAQTDRTLNRQAAARCSNHNHKRTGNASTSGNPGVLSKKCNKHPSREKNDATPACGLWPMACKERSGCCRQAQVAAPRASLAQRSSLLQKQVLTDSSVMFVTLAGSSRLLQEAAGPSPCSGLRAAVQDQKICRRCDLCAIIALDRVAESTPHSCLSDYHSAGCRVFFLALEVGGYPSNL